jgi:Tfp pilus assembly PilM family ATPase/Tfp pilus assembly protein PilN
MGPRGKKPSASTTVTLEVSPRVAKAVIASPSPLTVHRVAASTVPEPSEDPTAALRALLASGSLGARQVGVLFGRESFSLRTLELPATDVKEITSMLELQLGKLTPYPRAEILFAWTVVGSFREGYTSVLLAIARKALIAGVLQLLKTKGIVPQWVGVSTEGLEAWWRALAPPPQGPGADDRLSALIDVDFASTDCAILSGDKLLFSHSIAIGAEQLGGSEQARLRWLGELVRLPRILLHEDIKGQIGRGVLTGVTQGLEGLTEQLTAQWGVPVDVREPLGALAPPASVTQAAAAARVSCAALAGLLASGKPPRLDLIPQETRVSQVLQVRSRHLARLAGSLAAILVLAAVLYLERIISLRHYLGELHRRLAPLEQTAQEIIQRQHAMQRVRGWLDPSRSALEVLRSVSAAVDPGITLTQLTLEEGRPVTIRGKASTMAGAFEFFGRLKQAGSFATVHPRSVAKAKGVDELGAEFEIVCELAGS